MSKSSSLLYLPRTSVFETNLYRQVDLYALAHAPDLIRGIFDKCQLTSYLDLVKTTLETRKNGSATNSAVTCTALALDCYEGALHSNGTDAEIKAALVGGLYAAIGRTHQRYTSHLSSYEAQVQLQTDHAKTPKHQQLKPEALAKALKAIACLQRPMGPKPTEFVARVMFDANRMTPYLPELVRQALYQELRQELCGDDPSDELCEKFYQELTRNFSQTEWLTRWGRLKAHHRNWPLTVRRLMADLKTKQFEELL